MNGNGNGDNSRTKDVFQEIIEAGKRKGVLTYSEISNNLDLDLFTIEDVDDLINLLGDMGIIVTEEEGEEISPEEVAAMDEKYGDAVQSYFASMGDISLLTKEEEVEVAKIIEEGREIILNILEPLLIFRVIKESFIEDEDIFLEDMANPEDIEGRQEKNIKNL